MRGPRHRVVLTGASGGLGTAMAAALAGASEAIILVGRDMGRLSAMQGALRSRHPGLFVETVAGDLVEEATRQRVHDAARSLREPVNLLINNAGINEFHAFESQDAGTIRSVVELNLVAPMLLTQKLLPLLETASRAQIVNVGSIFGYLGYPGLAAYSASKFGLRGFSQALRRELGDTAISVRYFAPRATRTAFNSGAMCAMNRELNVGEDAPDFVAARLVRFIDRAAWEEKLGIAERFYVLLNRLLPGLNDGAIRSQLKTIRKHLPGASAPASR